MGSRKEEERNEKIIRGLMKLPPNRRCINCNSLGPQYVCTNFWTFVCITCSGIHREFTHRVKSVSMSKFTSQEVEALQNGGNQRARDIYLRDWDQQRQRLPDNSNVDKVRDFIKSLYVDRRYAGVKASEKPPRDLQSLRSPGDEIRRASSYHSYSQSPPYDFQYEDRRYGKQATTLTRKPGSDRSLYVGKMSSFICSPTRLSEKTLEDRFANEGSVSRVSDYSVSSGGDQVRSGAESPNFQKDFAFNSPPYQHPGDVLREDVKLQTMNSFSDTSTKIDANGFPHPESTASASHGSVDASRAPAPPESGSSASNIDLFQLAERSVAPSVDLFQMPQLDPAPSMSLHQPFQTSSPSTFDLFSGIYQQQQAASVSIISSESLAPKNEGWATFDIPQPATSTMGTGCLTPSAIPSNIVSSTTVDQMSSSNANMKWPQFQTSISQASDPWQKEGLHIGQAFSSNGSAQVNSASFELLFVPVHHWNAFDNSSAHYPMEETSESQVALFNPLSAASTNQFSGVKVSEDFAKDAIERPVSHLPFPDHSALGDIVMGPSYVDTRMHGDHLSTNPFDIPFESNSESNNMFLDMSSLQAALPDGQLPTTFLDGVNQPWFPPDPMMTYVPGPSQGGLAYVAGQAANPQLASVQTQEPVASVGGNPFA